METKFSKIDETTHNFEIICGKEEFEKLYNAELTKVQQTVEMKGFRKGRVPLPMVKQRFGQEIFHEICFEFSNSEFSKYANEVKIHIAGSPFLKDIKTEEDGKVICLLEYEVHPEFDLVDYNSIVIDEPVYIVDDEDIDTFIDKIKMEYGSEEETDSADDQYYSLTIEITEIDKTSGETMKEPFELPGLRLTDRAIAPKLRERLMNVKIGDEFEFDAADVNPMRRNEIMKIKILGIKKIVLGELTEDIISKISNGRFDTVEDLREDVALSLQENLNKLSQQALENNLRLKVIETYSNVAIPKQHINMILEEYLVNDAKRRNIDPEKIVKDEAILEPLRKDVEKSYLWSLVSARIAEKENIQLEDSDVEDAFTAMGLPAEMATLEFMKKMDKDGNATRQMLDQKILDFILSSTTTNNVTVEREEKLVALANLNYKINKGAGDDSLAEFDPDAFEDNDDLYDVEEEHVHDEHCGHNH